MGATAVPRVVAHVGQAVTWRHEPRGGWGYTVRVPAYVVTSGPKRIGIAALSADGEWVPRWVTADRLELRVPDITTKET